MKVAVFTLTRDRLDYTKRTFKSMRESRPGHAYDHWVYDQGSEDGTVEWLQEQQLGCTERIHKVVAFGENKGLHVAKNIAYGEMLKAGYDYILKVDNDCEFKTKHWLKKLIRAQKALGEGAVVSPRVRGLNHPPPVWGRKVIDGFRFSFVEIIGGIARLVPRESIENYKFNERQPMAFNASDSYAHYCHENNIPMAYVENIVVKHMDSTSGQVEALPDYFARSFYERLVPYGL